MLHTHGCGVHRDMRIEAQAARLENAILDTRDREHREADRFCNATCLSVRATWRQLYFLLVVANLMREDGTIGVPLGTFNTTSS